MDSEQQFWCIAHDSKEVDVNKCSLSSSVPGATSLMQVMADSYEKKKYIHMYIEIACGYTMREKSLWQGCITVTRQKVLQSR